MRADELLRHRYFVSDQIPASSLPRKYSATNADYRNTRKCHWANQFTKRIRGALRATGIKRKLADRWRANFLIFCAALQSQPVSLARGTVFWARGPVCVLRLRAGNCNPPRILITELIVSVQKGCYATQDLQNLLAWATR